MTQAKLLKRKAIPKGLERELKAFSYLAKALVPMLWFYITCSHFGHYVHVLPKISSLPSVLPERPLSNNMGKAAPRGKGKSDGMWAGASQLALSSWQCCS